MKATKTSPKATDNNRYAGLLVKRDRHRIIVGREDKSALNTMGLDVAKMVADGNNSKCSECIQCGACVDSCNKKAIKYSFKWK